MGMILIENKKVLMKKYPKYYDYLTESVVSSLCIEWNQARDGSTAITVETENGKIRLNSTYQPIREAVKWAEQYDYKNININVFMFGMGNGIFVREILSRMKDDARLFILEPDFAILSHVFEKIDVSDILSDRRVELIVDNVEADKFQKLAQQYIHWSNIPTQILCFHPGYDKLYQREFSDYWHRLKRMTERAKVIRNTNAHFAEKSLNNIIKNLQFIKESNYIDELKDKFIDRGKTAIIVAAGPSLDKNIEYLRMAENRAFIMAVDSIVKRLDEEGILYDCVVTIDPDKKTGDLEECVSWRNTPLFCSLDSKYEIMSAHRGKKIWYTGAGLLSILYDGQGIAFEKKVQGGGSVATVAFAIAEFLGFETIILVGQDLAYQGDITHAGGKRGYYIKNEESSVQWIDGIDGELVKSRFDWIYYRDWFEERIAYNKNLHVIDATEGGALIHGSEVCSLEDAVKKCCSGNLSFKDIVGQITPTFNDEKYMALRKDILHIEKELDNIKRKTEDGLMYCREYLENRKYLNQKKHDRLIKDIGKANNYIILQKRANILLDIYASSLALQELADINKVTEDPIQDEINSVKRAQIIYNVYNEGTKVIKGRLLDMLKII